MVDDRSLAAPVWMLTAAFVYLAAVSAVFVQEAEAPDRPLLPLFVASLVTGLVVRRFRTVLVAFAGIVAVLVAIGWVDEDMPLAAIVGGLLLGAAAARAYVGAASRDAAAHRWSLAKRALRPVVSKATFERFNDLLDRLRFRIDTIPNGLYQPVPGLPAKAARTTGSESRWSAIEPLLERLHVASAMDIGACEGYFALKLGAAGVPTIAVESTPSNYRTALLAAKRNRAANVGVLALEVTPQNVFTLPPADCVLCLSVWHHFVRAYGFDLATEMLAELWVLSRRALVFDTGETEMTPEYGLPAMVPDARTWLSAYLEETCPGGTVEHLGRHRAFDPGGSPCERNLFAVIRG